MIIQPPAVIVMGPSGSGKTDSLATFIEAGLETFVIVTEPDGVGSLIDSCARRRLSIDRLHWSYCPPAAAGVTALKEMAEKISNMGFEQLQSIKAGVGKAETREPAYKLLSQIANFHCDRTGQDFGPVDKFEHNRALALDSLSGLNLMAMMLTIGYKPSAHQGEWGVGMNFIEQVLNTLTSDRQCFFALVAHVEREVNELVGSTQIMVSTLGRKLAPKIPRFFSEVVYAKRMVDKATAKFTWSTVDSQADLKNRSLPISSDLVPSFVPIVEAYRKRVSLIEASATGPAQDPKVVNIQTPPMRPKET